MAIVKIVELVGASKESWEDAVHQIVAEASAVDRSIVRGIPFRPTDKNARIRADAH